MLAARGASITGEMYLPLGESNVAAVVAQLVVSLPDGGPCYALRELRCLQSIKILLDFVCACVQA